MLEFKLKWERQFDGIVRVDPFRCEGWGGWPMTTVCWIIGHGAHGTRRLFESPTKSRDRVDLCGNDGIWEGEIYRSRFWIRDLGFETDAEKLQKVVEKKRSKDQGRAKQLNKAALDYERYGYAAGAVADAVAGVAAQPGLRIMQDFNWAARAAGFDFAQAVGQAQLQQGVAGNLYNADLAVQEGVELNIVGAQQAEDVVEADPEPAEVDLDPEDDGHENGD